MKRNGNISSNRTYNPQNAKPHIPLDVDEVDAVLERFIRQKYDQQTFSSGTVRPAARHDTGSTRSSEDQPPPLPPKPARRFGFGLRAASSTLPSRTSQISPPESPNGLNGYGPPSPPIRVNKQSRIFGASVGGTAGDNLESKLATLRDMGFPDEKRNANILKGLGGNLEHAIESLVRLGEGSAPPTRSRTPIPARDIAISQPLNLSLSSSRTASHSTAVQSTANTPALNPLASSQEQANNQNTDHPNNQTSQAFISSNPFQSQPYNPFEPSMPQSATYPLERAFAGMQVSQPLFPNATGGYPSQQQQIQDARLQQSMTPPVTQTPNHLYQSNPYVQQLQSPMGHNPFFQNTQQTVFNSSVSYPFTGQHQSAMPSSNPFLQSSMTQSPIGEYPVQPSQTYPLEQQPQQSQPPQSSRHQTLQRQPPFGHDAASQGQQLANHSMLQHQPVSRLTQNLPRQFPLSNQPEPQPLQPQQTGRFDNSSILALYNYPQLAPPPLPTTSQESPSSTSPASGQLTGSPAFQQQRSVTMPTALSSGSRNPFHNAASNTQAVARPSAASAVGISRHVSQESVDIGGFQNGRHSPDAFASLSANLVR